MMANRPIFVPLTNKVGVRAVDTEFKWFPGLSKAQKQRSVAALHQAGEAANISAILEISSKSTIPEGVMMSAFNLQIRPGLTVESAYQASKIFEHGGPFLDLLEKDSRAAKKDPRLKESGKIIGFEFDGDKFPANPINFFYDWLYINALTQYHNLKLVALKYDGFTDIEFNPGKSINCQARATALLVSLVQNLRLVEALKSPTHFLKETL
jgi:hypothetical protein